MQTVSYMSLKRPKKSAEQARFFSKRFTLRHRADCLAILSLRFRLRLLLLILRRLGLDAEVGAFSIQLSAISKHLSADR